MIGIYIKKITRKIVKNIFLTSKSDGADIFYHKPSYIKKYNQPIKIFFHKKAEMTEMTYKINVLCKCLDISI